VRDPQGGLGNHANEVSLVKLDRPLTVLICCLIVAAAWMAAHTAGWLRPALASAAAITVMCAALVFLRLPTRRSIADSPRRQPKRDESAQFRRKLFNLCAALKLGIRFCEDRLEAEPEELIEQLQQMADNIDSLINETTRPVRFGEATPWPWRYARSLWPWRGPQVGNRK